MSKTKALDMSAFLEAGTEQMPPSLTAEHVKASLSNAKTPKLKRAVGRPPKAPDDLAKQTAIRLDPDDLKKVKKLAVDDGMTFNRVVYLALESYCNTRGVILAGASKK